MSYIDRNEPNRVTTYANSQEIVCTELSIRTECVGNDTLSSFQGGLVVPGPIHGAPAAVAAVWRPSMNAGDAVITTGVALISVYSQEVKSAISSAATSVGNTLDSIGDTVSQYYESGSNTLLKFGNGYF